VSTPGSSSSKGWIRPAFSAILLIAGEVPTRAAAVDVFKDTFDGNNNPLGHYFTRRQDTTLSVVDDGGAGGIGSGNALRIVAGSANAPFLREFYSGRTTVGVGSRLTLG
jgi:hypothetical protein